MTRCDRFFLNDAPLFRQSFRRRHINRISLENFVAQWHATPRNNKANADLFAIAPLVTRVASLRSSKSASLKVGAGDVVQKQVVLEVEQRPDRSLRWHSNASLSGSRTSIARYSRLSSKHSSGHQQLGERCFRIPLFRRVEFAGGSSSRAMIRSAN